MPNKHTGVDRRTFLKTGASVAVVTAGGRTANAADTQPAEAPRLNGMPMRALPRSGRMMPIFGLGTATMSGQYDPRPHEQKAAVVRYAYEQGVRYFDTAAGYKTASLLGDALHDVREDVFLNTKTMSATPEGARKDVETALAELKTDVIDCVKLHLPWNYDTAMTVLDELEKMRGEGKIKLLGMSNHVHFETAYKIIDTGRLDEVLIARSYFPKGETEILVPRNLEFREMALARAQELGMNIIGMKALGGFVFSQLHTMWAPDFEPEKGAKLPAAAIRWAISDNRFHLYIIGCEQQAQIDRNVRLCGQDLTPTAEDRKLLAEFTSKVWDSELVKKCPVLYDDPNTPPDMAKYLQGRKAVMEEVVKHASKIWAQQATG